MVYKDHPILDYHETSKHHYHKLANAPQYMDWANQPNPFRQYKGTKQIELPLLKNDLNVKYLNLYNRNNNLFQEFNIKNISSFLELSLGISAWKVLESSKWSLRINPSSGNLHPIEAYLLLPQLDKGDPGIYHYNAFSHSLELRAKSSTNSSKWLSLHFETNGFFIALSTIFWRESWKYGERAFRYCQTDVGHAIACISFSANIHGWKAVYLNALSDDDIDDMFGLKKHHSVEEEKEHPALAFFIHNPKDNTSKRGVPNYFIEKCSNLIFHGQPNKLSKTHLKWNGINSIASASRKKRSPSKIITLTEKNIINNIKSELTAIQIIRNRRSGISYDCKTYITKNQLISILDKTIPRYNHAPFDAEIIEPSTHLLLFIHRVKDLKEGLYFLIRNPKHLDSIKTSSNPKFKWSSITELLPLYLLKEGNYQEEAINICCNQSIAGDCTFTVAMLSKFSDNIRQGNELYRHLFWEAGMIGQVLYLEAEANKLRGTGIGCYFDDAIHDIMGLTGYAYQCLYQFAIGGYIEKAQLKTIPPYNHLNKIT